MYFATDVYFPEFSMASEQSKGFPFSDIYLLHH